MRRPHPTLVLFALAVLSAGGVWGVMRFTPRPDPIDTRGRKYDAIEDDERVKPILAAVDQEVAMIVANDPPELKVQLGYCHRVWGLKKDLLREKYGIEWRTPKEMNPGVAYD